jgi:hypothetical protein
MLQFVIIILSLTKAMAVDLGPQKECFRYSYLKSSMNQSTAEKSCEKIDNRFALACSKLAIAYLYRQNQVDLLDSCSKIRNEKALSCVIKKAMQAKGDHAKRIQQCS